MEIVQYVNKVGKQINHSTKFNSNLDSVSITNIVLVNHLSKVYDWLESELASNYLNFPFTVEDLTKIDKYINCLKKEINFYATKEIDDDCILTEVDELIIQE